MVKVPNDYPKRETAQESELIPTNLAALSHVVVVPTAGKYLPRFDPANSSPAVASGMDVGYIRLSFLLKKTLEGNNIASRALVTLCL